VVAAWIEQLGIHDADSGYEAAWSARERIFEPARRVIASADSVTSLLLVFQGFVARGQGLHEAAVAAAKAENPHAAFTLLRAYAENAAGLLYAKDEPAEVVRFWDPDGHAIPIGRITNHADSRFGGFRAIYGQLSQFAHPQALGILASTVITDDGALRWVSAPRFKNPDEQLLAYAWVVELAEATRHLLYEFAQRHALGYFARQSQIEGA
jgi:hypothetical protein